MKKKNYTIFLCKHTKNTEKTQNKKKRREKNVNAIVKVSKTTVFTALHSY